MSDDTNTKPGKAAETDDEILKEARERKKLCDEASSDNINDAKADLEFLKGGINQWDAQAVQTREAQKRPMITVNTLPTYLHQVTNDQRMNTPSIKVHPVGEGADVETAETIQGYIRNCEYESNADVAYDTAVNSAAAVGFGYFGLTPAYVSENSFEQELKFVRYSNALAIKIDPLSTEPDGSDMQYAFIEELMDRGEFDRKYPDANAGDLDLVKDVSYTGWLMQSTVLVCAYYRISKKSAQVVQLSNGESGYREDLQELPDGVTIKNTRPGTRSKVEWFKITGCDILERTELKMKGGKHIPLFPVYGDELNIEGKITRSGIVRHAKGPAQMYNVMITAATEEVAARAKNPYIMAEGQDEGYEDEWAQANTTAMPYLRYKPVTLDGNLAPPPQRNPMAEVPTGWLALGMHASDNVKKTTGLFDASLGAKGTATSGVQERAQQKEGDVANFHYSDGLNRTIRHAGRVFLAMMPYYIDTQRTVRLLGEDDKADYAEVNKPNVEGKPGADGKVRKMLNDLTSGEYGVTVSAGPSYSTLRQEAAEGMGDIMGKNPQLWPVVGDLYVRSQDWPNADKMADRLEKGLAPEFKDPPKEGDEQEPHVMLPEGPLALSHVPQAIESLKGQVAQAHDAMQKANVDKQTEAANKSQTELMRQQEAMARVQIDQKKLEVEEQKLQVEAYRAETERKKLGLESDLATHTGAVDKAGLLLQERAQDTADMTAQHQRKLAETEASKPPPAPPALPTADDIAKAMAKANPPPKSMTIKGQSGQTYEVSLH